MIRYLALTIGPVYTTLTNVRSTKALWSASYLFSWLMREILKKLRNTKGVTLLNLPNKDDLFQDGKGVGLFSDRLTARLDPDVKVDLPTIVREIVARLAQTMADDLNAAQYQRADEDHKKTQPNPLYTKEEIETFLSQYLRLLSVEFELPTSELNPVKTADAFLNSLELQASFAPSQERDYLGVFFEDLFFNTFIRKEFGQDAGFPSTLEIGTSSFVEHHPNNYLDAVKSLRKFDIDPDAPESRRKQEDFIRKVRNIGGERFKLCHKYIAMVRADGDHVGHLFKTLLVEDAQNPKPDVEGRSRAQQLADALAEFSLAAADAITKFGGKPVYAGGDDLLFFAPVSIEKLKQVFIDRYDWSRENIFDLLDTIDTLFLEKIIESDVVKASIQALGNQVPTMSYGLSISHHKYPMAESLKIGNDLLFDKIKREDQRNGIGWKVTKHSGSSFGIVEQKQNAAHQIFKDLLGTKLKGEEQKDAFLASVMFKLESLEGLFQATAHQPREHFENIIFNNFNERIHRDGKELSPFLKKIVELLVACFEDNPVAQASDKTTAVQKNLERAYSALRFVHFLETNDKN